MQTYDASPAARRPLTAMFWSARGWRDPVLPPAPADLARAVAAGVMFDRPRQDDHDGWLAAARQAAASLSAREVGDAFLASLGSRRLDLRSALGSYGRIRSLPDHTFRKRGGGRMCAGCDQYPTSEEDLNILNFERFRWGGVRHHYVAYTAFDLEQFALAPRLDVTAEDRRLGHLIVDALRALPAGVGMGRAVAALRDVPGNRDEREILLLILQSGGVWQPEGIDDDALHEYLRL